MIGSLVEIPGGLKFAVMAMLLAAAGGLTRYYHHVLGTGTFFTHFYYLPIVLGAIWWKRRGLAVVLLLSAMLVASDHLFGFKESAANDTLRIGMFLLVAVVSVLLSEGLEKARQTAVENRLWYETIFQNTGTATAILSRGAVILLANTQFANLADCSIPQLEEGKSLFDFIPKRHREDTKAYYRGTRDKTAHTPGHLDIHFQRGNGDIKQVRITFSLIPDTANVVATLTDLTELKTAMKEQKRLEAQLAETLAKVLSGYLPICSRCKKIREDSGQWREVESYIHARTAADFTHTICPDCARLLYPEIVAQMSGTEKKQLLGNDPDKPHK